MGISRWIPRYSLAAQLAGMLTLAVLIGVNLQRPNYDLGCPAPIQSWRIRDGYFSLAMVALNLTFATALAATVGLMVDRIMGRAKQVHWQHLAGASILLIMAAISLQRQDSYSDWRSVGWPWHFVIVYGDEPFFYSAKLIANWIVCIMLCGMALSTFIHIEDSIRRMRQQMPMLTATFLPALVAIALLVLMNATSTINIPPEDYQAQRHWMGWPAPALTWQDDPRMYVYVNYALAVLNLCFAFYTVALIRELTRIRLGDARWPAWATVMLAAALVVCALNMVPATVIRNGRLEVCSGWPCSMYGYSSSWNGALYSVDDLVANMFSGAVIVGGAGCIALLRTWRAIARPVSVCPAPSARE